MPHYAPHVSYYFTHVAVPNSLSPQSAAAADTDLQTQLSQLQSLNAILEYFLREHPEVQPQFQPIHSALNAFIDRITVGADDTKDV